MTVEYEIDNQDTKFLNVITWIASMKFRWLCAHCVVIVIATDGECSSCTVYASSTSLPFFVNFHLELLNFECLLYCILFPRQIVSYCRSKPISPISVAGVNSAVCEKLKMVNMFIHPWIVVISKAVQYRSKPFFFHNNEFLNKFFFRDFPFRW